MLTVALPSEMAAVPQPLQDIRT